MKSATKKSPKKKKAATQPKRSKSTPKKKQKVFVAPFPARKFWFLWYVGVIFAIACALLIRVPFFGHLPNGLNRDEAALGYNAYSLLKTGRDEYGKPWPVSITSFGDQKLPGYVYTLIPFIATFGLNPVTIRLPSFLAGLVVIAGLGLVAIQIGTRLNFSHWKKLSWSWLAMILVAVSPWADHFSRTAYEAHISMAAFILAFVAYQFAIDHSKKSVQRAFLIVASVLWSFTLLTYHSYHILTPLFILALIVIDFAKWKKADRIGVLYGWVIGVVAIALLVFGGVVQANAVKSIGISPFHTLLQTATDYRNVLPGNNTFYKKLFANQLTEGIVVLAQNVVTVVSGTFFFVHGSGHGDHNPGNFANFNLFDAPFVLFGLLQLWENRKNESVKRVALWLCLGILPAAITISPLLEVRLSPMFPLLELLAGLGMTTVLFDLKKVWQKKIAVVILAAVILMGTIRMFLNYTYIIPSQVESHYKFEMLGRVLARYQKLGFPVITQSPSSSPYIWYLVESQYDPAKLNANIERYSVDSEGFIHVKRIGNVSFETIQWEDLLARSKKQPLILIFTPQEMPAERVKTGVKLLETIKDEHSEVAYDVWQLGG